MTKKLTPQEKAYRTGLRKKFTRAARTARMNAVTVQNAAYTAYAKNPSSVNRKAYRVAGVNAAWAASDAADAADAKRAATKLRAAAKRAGKK